MMGTAVLVMVMAACAAPGTASPSDTSTPAATSPSTSAGSEPPEGTDLIGDVPQELLDQILADASRRTGVAVDELEITFAEAITWSDGSLDCPEPGQLYTQALVDGHQVVIDAAGEELDYRAAGGGFRLCETPRGG